jgi:hypothetical protein
MPPPVPCSCVCVCICVLTYVYVPPTDVPVPLVHVLDVAEAHVRALTSEEAVGKRFLLVEVSGWVWASCGSWCSGVPGTVRVILIFLFTMCLCFLF